MKAFTHQNFSKKNLGGFTLIELLVVIGIMVILMAAAIVAINPFRQFAMANNAARLSGVTTIMNAIYQNIVDNKGLWGGDLPTPPTNCSTLPTTETSIGSGATQTNICGCIVTDYVATMPVDPQHGRYADCTNYNTGTDGAEMTTGYTIRRPAGGRITICAKGTQIPPETAEICISR